MYRQPLKINNRFYNNNHNYPESLLFKTALTVLQSLRNRAKRVPKVLSDWYTCSIPATCAVEPVITWIGHATFLIQIENVNIITDPIFGDASLLYRRVLPPGIALNQLPLIDVILLSHNHRDHMDTASLVAIKKQFPKAYVLVPVGDKQWFDLRGFSHVSELGWWEQYKIKNITFTFLPATHWSQRGLFDKNRSLWGSWMIQSANSTIYFAGDTAWDSHFYEIKSYFNTIDTALMPIGPCEPEDTMQHSHISAVQAGQAFLDLDANNFIPMHWGTFLFGVDHFLTPVERIQSWWQENSHLLTNKRLYIAKVGQNITLNRPFF